MTITEVDAGKNHQKTKKQKQNKKPNNPESSVCSFDPTELLITSLCFQKCLIKCLSTVILFICL